MASAQVCSFVPLDAGFLGSVGSATSVCPTTAPVLPLSKPLLLSDAHVSSSMVFNAQIHEPRLRESKTLAFGMRVRTFTRSVEPGWLRLTL